jgi:hypothetical protein
MDHRTADEQVLHGDVTLTRPQRQAALAQLVEDCISRDAWAVRGGSSAQLWTVGDFLLVYHDEIGQRDISRLLDALRRDGTAWKSGTDPRDSLQDKRACMTSEA